MSHRRSVFSVFRKNQKAMMAVFGVLLMIAFTAGGVLDDLVGMGRGGSGRSQVVATTAYGNITDNDLAFMMDRRNILNQFIQQVASVALPRMADKATVELEKAWKGLFSGQQLSQVARNNAWNIAQGRLQGAVSDLANNLAILQDYKADREKLVTTRILADQMTKQGVVISDGAITDYLREMTDDTVTGAEYAQILGSIRVGDRHSGVSQAMLYDALRTQLLAIEAIRMFQSSLGSIEPAERWEEFEKLNRQATIELAPVKAEDYLSKVPEPKDAELAAFFEKHKNEVERPGSPEPGFKLPYQAQFEYFMADAAAFKERELKDVTAEEVQKYYDAHKEQYRYRDHGDLESDLPKPAAKDATKAAQEAAEAANENKPADKKTPPAKTEPPKSATESKPDAGDKTNPPAPKAETPAKPEAPSKTEPTTKSEGTNDGDEDELLDEIDEPAEKTKDEKSKDEKPADNKPADSKPTDEKPAPAKTDEKPAEEKPATDKKDEGKPAAEAPAAEKPRPTPPPALSSTYVLPRDISKGPDPLYEPLWRVESEIRDKVATQKANERIEKEFKTLQGKMQKYGSDIASWESRRKQKPDLKKPQSPDFAAMAKEVGLQFVQTALVNEYQAADLPNIGKSHLKDANGISFAQYNYEMVRPGQGLYQTERFADTYSNQYLAWKVQEVKARVPTLAEVRSHVAHIWKLVQARELIRKDAEALVKQAKEGNGSLKDRLAGKTSAPVTEAGPFSWLTAGTAAQFNRDASRNPPKISEVPGVDYVDNAFMQSIFSLKPGDVGIAMNAPQTIAYVVRATTFSPSETALRDRFLLERSQTFDQLAGQERAQLFRDWLESRRKEARLAWAHNPTAQETDEQ